MSAVYGNSSATAGEISFDNTGSSLTATNLQDAIIESSSLSSYDINRILADNHFDSLFDNEGNLLEGLT